MALITKTSRYDRGNRRHQGFRTDGSPEDFPVSELSELASEPETSRYDWGNHGSPEDVPVSEVSELASELELEMVMECHGSETGKPAQMAAGTSM